MEKIKASDIIAEVDHLKINNYQFSKKLEWLQDVEDRIQMEIIDTHENPEGIKTGKMDEDTLLIAAGPYADIYRHYLTAQINKSNEEYDRYNNEITLYYDAYETFQRMWHNTHMPVNKGNFKM